MYSNKVIALYISMCKKAGQLQQLRQEQFLLQINVKQIQFLWKWETQQTVALSCMSHKKLKTTL